MLGAGSSADAAQPASAWEKNAQGSRLTVSWSPCILEHPESATTTLQACITCPPSIHMTVDASEVALIVPPGCVFLLWVPRNDGQPARGRELKDALFAFCSHTYLYYGVCLCVILVHVSMYVYTWRATIFFYIYRMKTLPALSFWRAEKIWILYSIASLLLASTWKSFFYFFFSFMFFLDRL